MQHFKHPRIHFSFSLYIKKNLRSTISKPLAAAIIHPAACYLIVLPFITATKLSHARERRVIPFTRACERWKLASIIRSSRRKSCWRTVTWRLASWRHGDYALPMDAAALCSTSAMWRIRVTSKVSGFFKETISEKNPFRRKKCSAFDLEDKKKY